MSVFKCKMCGGTIEFEPGASVGVCDSCGTKQTLPKLDDAQKENLYDRANHFRRNNDYDKAISVYEQILNEDNTDAEAYWSIVLCRYGIEYVEDPSTHKYIPTVNRTQYTSIFDDIDYKSAVRYADEKQRALYQSEAQAINDIQKRILDISSKEKPFDIFICYKETDEKGRRTTDSVLATDIYYGLLEDGYRVFFSKITLEDKLGEEYEPYIFAAIHSAPIMIVVGTKPEFFESIWVKNEWSRFLSLMKNGERKLLIPAYRDMQPEELPVEFAHLQSQDMSKLGFLQDIKRGIGKILGERTKSQNTKNNDSSFVKNDFNVSTTLDKAFLFIEDGNISRAVELLNDVFEIDPKNPLIYVGHLLIENNIKTIQDLINCSSPLETSQHFNKAIRFSDNELRSFLIKTNEQIIERNNEKKYRSACSVLDDDDSINKYQEAKNIFLQIPNYKDSSEKIAFCDEQISLSEKEGIYKSAKELLEIKHRSLEKEKNNALKAIELLSQINDYKNSIEVIDAANRVVYNCDSKIKKQRRRKRIIWTAATLIILVPTIVFFVVSKIIIPNYIYNQAEKLFSEDKWEEAYNKYIQITDYSNSKNKANECLYQQALILRNNKKIDEANLLFEQILNYKDSSKLYHPTHEWVVTDEKEVTCAEEGYISYICNECGCERTDILPMYDGITLIAEHLWTSTDLKKSTCKESGYQNFICEICGETKQTFIPIRSDHTYVITGTKSATCAEAGYKKYVCEICGKTLEYSLPKVSGHTWETTESKNATCSAEGYKKYKCKVCGKTQKDTVSALGHSWNLATCTKPKTCSRCGKTEGTALGHTNTATCTRCGVVLFKTLTYTGTGSDVITNINLPKGTFRIICTMISGESNMDMKLNYGNTTNSYDLIFNDYTAGSSEITTISGPLDNGAITVNAGTSYRGVKTTWKIIIEAIG